MKTTSKSKILKIFAFGAVIATPVLFMTSCSSSEPGKRYEPQLYYNGDTLDKLGIKNEAVKTALNEFVPVAAGIHLLNNNNILPNTLMNNTGQSDFNALMSLPYVSGSGPFIDTSKDIGLTLYKIDVKNNIDTVPELKSEKPDQQKTAKLEVSSIELEYGFYNRYTQDPINDASTIKECMDYWIKSGNVVDNALKTAMENAKTSYKVELSFKGEYEFSGDKEKNWYLTKGTWTFNTAEGSELKGKTIIGQGENIGNSKDPRVELSKSISDYITRSQNYKDNVEKSFYEEAHEKFRGLIKQVN